MSKPLDEELRRQQRGSRREQREVQWARRRASASDRAWRARDAAELIDPDFEDLFG